MSHPPARSPQIWLAYQFLVPAFAVAMVAAFLGEPVVGGRLAGGAVIVLGTLVTRSRWLGAWFGQLEARSARRPALAPAAPACLDTRQPAA